MPEEPQNVDQQQPLTQPQPQSQLQPQPRSIVQPQPQPETINFNASQNVESIAPDTSVVASNPQPVTPPAAANNISAEPMQTTYAPQPQFGTDQDSTTSIDSQTEPVVATPIFSQPQSMPTPKKGKKGIVIAAIAAGILITMGGGSVLAYNVWYSNPEKVISDAIVNAITTKNPVYTGVLSVENDNFNVTVDVTTKQADTAGSLDAKLSLTTEGKKFAVNGGAIFDQSGNLFFKVGGLRSIYEVFSNSGVSVEGLDEFITKVDNKWIKISSTDLKTYNESLASSNTCFNDTIKKFKDDGTVMAEITDLYRKNPFIIIEKDLGTINGSRGFEINTKNSVIKTFMDGLKDTKVYKELHSCDETFTIDTTDMIADNATSDDTNKPTVQLWVDSWSHQITKFSVEDDNKDSGQLSKLSIEPKYNQDTKIEAPTDFITLAQLQAEIEKITQSLYDSQPNYQDDDSDYPSLETNDYSTSRKLNKILQNKDNFKFKNLR